MYCIYIYTHMCTYVCIRVSVCVCVYASVLATCTVQVVDELKDGTESFCMLKAPRLHLELVEEEEEHYFVFILV